MSNKDKEDKWIGWIVYGSLICFAVFAYFSTGGDLKEALGDAFTWWGYLMAAVIFVGLAVISFKKEPWGCLWLIVFMGIFFVLVRSGALDGCSNSGDPNCYHGPRGVICD